MFAGFDVHACTILRYPLFLQLVTSFSNYKSWPVAALTRVLWSERLSHWEFL